MAKVKESKPHDGSYRRLFSHPQMVEALLRRYVAQPWVERLDFSTLEQVPGHYVSAEHQQRESDLVWRLRLESDPGTEDGLEPEPGKSLWFYIYILLEFQSRPDRFMAVRLLSYLSLFYEWLITVKKLTASRRLPPVLPIVLYNGQRRWTAPVQIADLIEPIFGGLESYLPRFEYLVLDEGHLPREDLEPLDNPVTAIFQLEQTREIEDLRRIVWQLAELTADEDYREIRRDFAAWLRRVLLPANFPDATIPDTGDLREIDEMLAETVKTWPKQWLAQGRQEGRTEGHREGRREGRREGQLEGSRQILQSQIEAKLGPLTPDFRHRLETATQDDLDRCAMRILTATSFEELFRD